MKNLTAWIQVKSSADYFERSPIFINPWQCYQLVWYQIVKVGFSLRWSPDPKEKHWLVDLLPAQAVGLCTPVVTQPTSCKIGFSCPCSAKPGCQSGPCLHWALQDRLLWCAQINQKSPGTAALSRAAFPPAAPASPTVVDMTSGVSSVSPERRFHNGLKFRLRKGFLVCCHCWLLFFSTPTTFVQPPSCPLDIFLFQCSHATLSVSSHCGQAFLPKNFIIFLALP